MSPWLAALTWALFALPALAFYFGLRSPPPAGLIGMATGGFLVLVYASVWLFWRPTAFEVGTDALRIVWPVRHREIPWSAVEHVSDITAEQFRAEHGPGARIGAGGLWGGFGLLKTRSETFSLWISRTDRFVIVRLRGARPLLLTPEEPARFVNAVNARVAKR